MTRRTAVGIALIVLLIAVLLWAAFLAVIVIVQGVPRGVEAQATASPEAWQFDFATAVALVGGAVLLTAAGILLSSGESHQRLSRRARAALTALIVLAVALWLFVLGVGGAMGWHDLGFAG